MLRHTGLTWGCIGVSSRHSESCLCISVCFCKCAHLCKTIGEHSYRHHSSVWQQLQNLCLQNMSQTWKENKRQVKSCIFGVSVSFSFPTSLPLLIREKTHHVIIFINNYQKQTPHRNTGLAVAALKQQSCLCGQSHTQSWATAVQQHSLHTLHSQDVCTCLYKLSHCLSAEQLKSGGRNVWVLVHIMHITERIATHP